MIRSEVIRVLSDRPIRVAMVGTGYVSPFHLAGWQSLQNVEVVALCSIDRGQAAERAMQFGVPKVYTGFEEMLDTEKPDVADICTPVSVHPPQVRASAERGIHVLCQKPLADSLDGARELTRVAADAGIRLMVHENFRFRIWYRELKEQLERGVIGRPYYCRSDARLGGTVLTAFSPEHPWTMMRHPHYAGVKRYLILESMIHQLDVCRFLFGDANRVYARARRISPFIKGEDLVSLIVDFDGLHAVVERSYASRGYPDPPLVSEKVVVEGERGSIFLDSDGTMHIEVDVPGKRLTERPEYPLENAYPNSFIAAIRHFVDCLRCGKPFETNPEENLQTLAITFAAYESLESGRVVELKSNC
jgi:predicted dehydrogenase